MSYTQMKYLYKHFEFFYIELLCAIHHLLTMSFILTSMDSWVIYIFGYNLVLCAFIFITQDSPALVMRRTFRRLLMYLIVIDVYVCTHMSAF